MEICMLVLFELDINLAYHIKVCLTRGKFVVNISRPWGKVHFSGRSDAQIACCRDNQDIQHCTLFHFAIPTVMRSFTCSR